MEKLLIELQLARMAALTGELDQAGTAVKVAARMVDAVKPPDSLYGSPREIRSYLAEAGFALVKADSRRAISALDEAIKALERYSVKTNPA